MTASVPVWFDGLAVGQVDVAADGTLSFRYADRWLQTDGAFPLSVTMPLRTEPYLSDIISPWLANLLPEEDQLRVLTRSLGLDQADVLAVLAEIGGDTAGALSFGAATDRGAWKYAPLTTFYDTADPRLALERHFEDLGRRPFLVGEEGVRQSLAGGQKKSALAVLSPDGEPVLRLPQDLRRPADRRPPGIGLLVFVNQRDGGELDLERFGGHVHCQIHHGLRLTLAEQRL